jgi:hypothetical protein
MINIKVIDHAPRMERESEDERWIWLSFAPEHRLILAAYAGAMTQNAADEIVKQTCTRIDEEKLPLFGNRRT